MIEIEHKYLLKNDEWKQYASDGERYQQAYISTKGDTTVRVRIAGTRAFLTLKGPREGKRGISRTEMEYEIPLGDGISMMKEFVDSPVIEKLRHIAVYKGKTWEIDEFFGDNNGLVVAEIELQSEDEAFELPPWVGECVSNDRRYGNSQLAKNPYKFWDK